MEKSFVKRKKHSYFRDMINWALSHPWLLYHRTKNDDNEVEKRYS